jgi:uncharacterized membrane protein
MNMSTRGFTPNIKVEHVISFSDAVFAFAITLMAISIDIPDLLQILVNHNCWTD